MDLIWRIVFVGVSCGMILLGLKIPKLFKGLYDSEKEERMLIKMSLTFKIAGISSLIFLIFDIIRKL